MRRAFAFSLSLLALVSLMSVDAVAASSRKSLATITGSVRDNRGNPLAGALVSMMREGVNTVKEARTDKQGNFIAKVSPGRYGIKAIASGFSEVVFAAVDVKPSQELVYRFNLEPVGYGNTLPERRRDREHHSFLDEGSRRAGAVGAGGARSRLSELSLGRREC